MSYSFTKLFSSITRSSIWCEDTPTRILWVTMLAIADRRGRVLASIPGIANEARISLEEAVKGITKLSSPDPYSRTKDFEGRRIEEIEGGWRIINYTKYRELRDDEDRKSYQREWVKAKRYGVDKDCRLSTNVDQCRPPSTQAEAEATSTVNSTSSYRGGVGGIEVAPNGAVAPVPAKAPPQKLVVMNPPTREEINLHALKIGLPDHEVEKFAAYYTSNGWRVGKNPMKNWQAAMVGWKTRWEQDGAKGMKAVQRELTDADHANGF